MKIKILIIINNILFANNEKIRYFSQKYIIFLFDKLIIWKTFFQNIILINIIKAKLFALLKINKKIIIFKRFCNFVKLNLGEYWKIFIIINK